MTNATAVFVRCTFRSIPGGPMAGGFALVHDDARVDIADSARRGPPTCVDGMRAACGQLPTRPA